MMQSKSGRTIFVDLNTIQDFYGKDSELKVSNVEIATKHFRNLMTELRKNRQIIFSGTDFNQATDTRFAEAGLKPYGVFGTPGQKKIVETEAKGAPIIPVSGKRKPWPDVQGLKSRGGTFAFDKNTFDLFDNPAFPELVKSAGARLLILFGALLEHDLHATAMTARARGLDVTIIEEASSFLNEVKALESKKELRHRGVKFETTHEVLTQLT